MWIGLNDLRAEGIYRFTSSLIASAMDKWGPNEPEPTTTKNCVGINKLSRDAEGGIGMTVRECDSKYAVLCEVPNAGI